jgi:hypothetical protein
MTIEPIGSALKNKQMAVLHHLSKVQLRDAWVSRVSRWNDENWRLDNLTPGMQGSTSTLAWGFDLPDGSTFTDPGHEGLLHEVRCFAWSLFNDRRFSKTMKAGSAANLMSSIKVLVRWMITNGYASLEALDTEASEEFLDDLASACAESNAPIRFDKVRLQLAVWKQLHQQRGALVGSGLIVMEEAPFGNRSPFALAALFAERVETKVPPLPDEVALPVLEAAIRFLGTPADDIIELQSRILAVRGQIGPHGGTSKCSERKAARRAIGGFRFSTVPGETEPWHPQIETFSTRRQKTKTVKRLAGVRAVLKPVAACRSLVKDAGDSAALVLQAFTGMRINELFSVEGGLDPETELPSCLETQVSADGLTTLYFVRGYVSKLRQAPEAVRWLLGSTPRVPRGKGASVDLPIGVRAVVVLERLFRPWRELGSQTGLILQIRSPRGLPNSPSQVAPGLAAATLKGQRHFVLNYVDLSELPDWSKRGEDLRPYRDSGGANLKTHQWRKNYCHYVLQVRPHLLPAVSQQFKHLSLAMTEQSYVVQDPFLRATMLDVTASTAVEFFYQASMGKPLGGRLGDIISEHMPELKELTKGTPARARKNIHRWLRTHDLRIFIADHGKCCIGLAPEKAQCHRLAGTTAWSNSRPNFQMREPGTCAGCQCYAVDEDTLPFWHNRRAESQAEFAAGEAAGLAHEYTVSKARVEQADRIIAAFSNLEAQNG